MKNQKTLTIFIKSIMIGIFLLSIFISKTNLNYYAGNNCIYAVSDNPAEEDPSPFTNPYTTGSIVS